MVTQNLYSIKEDKLLQKKFKKATIANKGQTAISGKYDYIVKATSLPECLDQIMSSV